MISTTNAWPGMVDGHDKFLPNACLRVAPGGVYSLL